MSTEFMALLVLVAAIVVVVLVRVASRKRSTDGVDSFRRQIDALSPAARRSVVDQVQHAATDDDVTGENEGDSSHGS